jgi:hypothetical protein
VSGKSARAGLRIRCVPSRGSSPRGVIPRCRHPEPRPVREDTRGSWATCGQATPPGQRHFWIPQAAPPPTSLPASTSVKVDGCRRVVRSASRAGRLLATSKWQANALPSGVVPRQHRKGRVQAPTGIPTQQPQVEALVLLLPPTRYIDNSVTPARIDAPAWAGRRWCGEALTIRRSGGEKFDPRAPLPRRNAVAIRATYRRGTAGSSTWARARRHRRRPVTPPRTPPQRHPAE